MKFKIGEIAIGQNLINQPEYNNMEGEIIGPLEHRAIKLIDGNKNPVWFCYMVRWCDGKKKAVRPENLRKRHEPGNWEDEQFKETLDKLGWNPLKTVLDPVVIEDA